VPADALRVGTCLTVCVKPLSFRSDVLHKVYSTVPPPAACSPAQVGSFGAFLLDRGVVTMSLAPRDGHEAQVQFALERGLPAMLGILATRRLPFPSCAFDLAHCSRCLIPWAANGSTALGPSGSIAEGHSEIRTVFVTGTHGLSLCDCLLQGLEYKMSLYEGGEFLAEIDRHTWPVTIPQSAARLKARTTASVTVTVTVTVCRGRVPGGD